MMRTENAPLDLIVTSILSLPAYQAVPGQTALHFVRLGPDQDLSEKSFHNRVFPSGDDAAILLQMQGKKGFSIPWDEMESVQLRLRAVGSKPTDDRFGTLTIRTKKHCRRFHLMRRGMTPEEAAAFFSPAADVLSVDLRRYEREAAEMAREEAAEKQRSAGRDPAQIRRRARLRYALLLTPLIGHLLRAFPISDRLFDWITTLLALLPMALCILLPNDFSVAYDFALRRQRKNDFASGVLMLAIGLGGILPMLHMHALESVMDWPRLGIAAVLFGAIMAFLMTYRDRVKRIWRIRAVLALWIACFSAGTVMNLNVLLDFHEPTVRKAVIEEQNMIGTGHTTYALYFSDLPEPVKVSKAEYDSLHPGDSVMLAEHAGAFGIRYVDAWPQL